MKLNVHECWHSYSRAHPTHWTEKDTVQSFREHFDHLINRIGRTENEHWLGYSHIETATAIIDSPTQLKGQHAFTVIWSPFFCRNVQLTSSIELHLSSFIHRLTHMSWGFFFFFSLLVFFLLCCHRLVRQFIRCFCDVFRGVIERNRFALCRTSMNDVA